MKTPIFDVILSVSGDRFTGEHCTDVKIVGRYKQHDGELVGQKECRTLDEALEYAKGAVTAFLKGTEA